MKEIEGNLLDLFDAGVFDVIAHGCNCFHNMGGGIAAQIAKRYPCALMVDIDTWTTAVEQLGKVTFIEYKNEKIGRSQIIANAYTQYMPGQSSPDVLYPSIRSCLQKIYRFTNSRDKIGLPLIGCGIAGGDWDIVSSIIKEELHGRDVTIVHFKPQQV